MGRYAESHYCANQDSYGETCFWKDVRYFRELNKPLIADGFKDSYLEDVNKLADSYDYGDRSWYSPMTDVKDRIEWWVENYGVRPGDVDVEQLVADILAGTAQQIEDNKVRIESYASGVLEETSDELVSYLTTVQGAYDEVIGSVSEIGSGVFENIQSLMQSGSDFITGAKQSAIDAYETGMSSVKSLYNTATDKLSTYAEDMLKQASLIYETSIDSLKENGEKARQFVETLVTDEVNTLHTYAQNSLEDIASVRDRVNTALDEGIAETLDEISGVAGIIGGTVSDVTASVGSILEEMQVSWIPTMVDVIASQQSMYEGVTAARDEYVKKDSSKPVKSILDDVLDPEASLYNSLQKLSDSFIGDTFIESIIVGFVGILVSVHYFMQGIGVLNTPRLDREMQTVNKDYPTKNYGAPDSIDLKTRGYMDESEARDALKREGYDDTKINTLFDGAYNPIDLNQAIQAWHRGFINDAQLERVFTRLKIHPDYFGTIRSLSDVIPSVQDLIVMAVREVFSKDLASELGLYQGVPQEFLDRAEKLGLSNDTAKLYWAAHWQLPSAQMGFEMFHREVIDSDALDKLLRALDYSPAWRDKLKEIAYQPITRVDIRRIYQIGLMDREELVRRHLHLGYSPIDAELMADFAELYVDVDTITDGTVVRDLTFSQVKNLFKLGTIDRDEAISRLTDIKYDFASASILVDSWNNEEAIQFREEMINRYTRKAIREDYNTAEIEGLFRDLALTTDEMTRVLQVIQVEQSEYDSIPSLTQLRDMYAGKIIDYATWYSTMRKHGYADEWIDAYRKLYELT